MDDVGPNSKLDQTFYLAMCTSTIWANLVSIALILWNRRMFAGTKRHKTRWKINIQARFLASCSTVDSSSFHFVYGWDWCNPIGANHCRTFYVLCSVRWVHAKTRLQVVKSNQEYNIQRSGNPRLLKSHCETFSLPVSIFTFNHLYLYLYPYPPHRRRFVAATYCWCHSSKLFHTATVNWLFAKTRSSPEVTSHWNQLSGSEEWN